MVDHRRTPSRRAYTLPGWFFALTAVACVVALGLTAWTFRGDDAELPSTRATPSTPVVTSSPATPKTTTPPPERRPPIAVEVLNASSTPGLAAKAAELAEKAGWTVGGVGNWQYGASHEAVYFPEGEQQAAEQLAEDLDIEAVEPAKKGMKINQLTVLVLD